MRLQKHFRLQVKVIRSMERDSAPDCDVFNQLDQFSGPENGVIPIKIEQIHADDDHQKGAKIQGESVGHACGPILPMLLSAKLLMLPRLFQP